MTPDADTIPNQPDQLWCWQELSIAAVFYPHDHEVRVSIHASIDNIGDLELVIERIKAEDRDEAVSVVTELRRKWAVRILAANGNPEP